MESCAFNQTPTMVIVDIVGAYQGLSNHQQHPTTIISCCKLDSDGRNLLTIYYWGVNWGLPFAWLVFQDGRVGRSTTQGHTEALKEEKMPGILDRAVARAAPRR